MLPGLRAPTVGVLLGIPVVGSGVGTAIHRRVVGTFKNGFCRVVMKNTTFGRRVRRFLGDVSFPCAIKCNVARYTPVVYCRS